MSYTTIRVLNLREGTIKIDSKLAKRFGDRLKKMQGGFYKIQDEICLKVGLEVDFKDDPPKWAGPFLEENEKPSKPESPEA